MRLRFFLSSPGDVADERTFAQQVIEQGCQRIPSCAAGSVAGGALGRPAGTGGDAGDTDAAGSGQSRAAAAFGVRLRDRRVVVVAGDAALPASCTAPTAAAISRAQMGIRGCHRREACSPTSSCIAGAARPSSATRSMRTTTSASPSTAGRTTSSSASNADGSLPAASLSTTPAGVPRPPARGSARLHPAPTRQRAGQQADRTRQPRRRRMDGLRRRSPAVLRCRSSVPASAAQGARRRALGPDAPRFLPSGNELSACLADEAGFPSGRTRPAGGGGVLLRPSDPRCPARATAFAARAGRAGQARRAAALLVARQSREAAADHHDQLRHPDRAGLPQRAETLRPGRISELRSSATPSCGGRTAP